jgi:hypothetical protein
MKKLLLMIVLYSLSASTLADQFYVAYEWKEEDQSRVKSWNTGSIDANINTASGILKLIDLIKKERGIKGSIVILFLKELQSENKVPFRKRKNYINT